MNWQIIFSTYVNTTGKQTPRKQLEKDLVAIAKLNDINGFSLSDQLGYWAGELEQSHVLTLLDVNKKTGQKVAKAVRDFYQQDAVILKPVKETVYFI